MYPLKKIIIENLKTDISQLQEEGFDKEQLEEELNVVINKNSYDKLIEFHEDILSRKPEGNYPYEEPNDWESISEYFPTNYAINDIDSDILKDKLLAAWQGRSAGCQLGKPVEGLMWPSNIEKAFREVDSWPIKDYINPSKNNEKNCLEFKNNERFVLPIKFKNSLCKGNFNAVSADDDIQYSIINLMLLEKFGFKFTSQEALENIIKNYPCNCGSSFQMKKNFLFGMKSPDTGFYGNSCKQSLGSQIRCDVFGWTSPGNPAFAARLAYKDAINSQTKNGIYSPIFFSALMADVLVHGDVLKGIETASKYIPPKSRFAEAIQNSKTLCDKHSDIKNIYTAILEKYKDVNNLFLHALPNAEIIICSLIRNHNDFSKAIADAVLCGLDTDCTAATVGSIMGCALGTKGISKHWTEPFNDTIESGGLQNVDYQETYSISELADRTFEIAYKNQKKE